MMDVHRTLPHNEEAEQALLGAALIDNRAAAKVRGLVSPSEFYITAHGRIWAAILHHTDRGERASPVTLKAYFDADDALSEVHGGTYLARLPAASTTADSVSAKRSCHIWA